MTITTSIAQEQSQKQPYKVLYAGKTDGDRKEDFVKFLSSRFKSVDVVAVRDLSIETAKPFDAVVLDVPNDDFKIMREYKIPEKFSRPTVVVGAMSARLADAHGLNIHDG